MKKRLIVGLTERVKITGKEKSRELVARIDTGAKKSSIDLDLAARLKLGPIFKTKTFRTSTGKEVRPLIWVNLEIKGTKTKASFNLTSRKNMRYKVLIGRNVIKKFGFLIDPLK